LVVKKKSGKISSVSSSDFAFGFGI